ncbi:Multiple epidermal growth factor-like domains protein 10 [Temnothorax longispinosus]|uniref:Multiple epidermal growth factor-like domains protein 10 n=1 Tax=Temnothorax longispinosus TaxID=300112 RepID=A0A4V3SB19_9HYME|nr:Multiple epidermal growth factor-like domains protein 10 [Temnothorax longispinosus]
MFCSRSSNLSGSAGMESAAWWLIVAATVIISTGASLEGPHVCTRQETYTITMKVSEKKPYTVRDIKACFIVIIPRWCTTYSLEYETVYKIQVGYLIRVYENVIKQRPVKECCKGYTETTKGDRCIPVCSEGCLYGTCIASDVCKCESGYRGSLCDTSESSLIFIIIITAGHAFRYTWRNKYSFIIVHVLFICDATVRYPT